MQLAAHHASLCTLRKGTWTAWKHTVLLSLSQSLRPQRAILKLEEHSAEGILNTGPGLAFGSSRVTDSGNSAPPSGSPEHYINCCGFFRCISSSPQILSDNEACQYYLAGILIHYGNSLMSNTKSGSPKHHPGLSTGKSHKSCLLVDKKQHSPDAFDDQANISHIVS